VADAIVTFTINPALDAATTTERLIPAEKLRCEVPRYFPGGGGVNVARAVHALGGEAVAVYAAGGLTGQMLTDLLAGEGVTSHPVAIRGTTRENLTVGEAQSGRQFRFVMPGPEVSEAECEACLEALRRVVPTPRYVVASGSLPRGVPPDYYARVAAVAAALGARMVLDTSGAALRAVGRGRVHLLKPNRRELEFFAGRPLSDLPQFSEAARAFVADGQAEIVVASLGAEGALLATSDGAEHFPALPIGVRGSVGAGDSMVAGIVLALARGLSVHRSVQFGMATAAAALLRPGVELCRREDVERIDAEFHGAAPGIGGPAV
jgi:6-phosphofructokinase 2